MASFSFACVMEWFPGAGVSLPDNRLRLQMILRYDLLARVVVRKCGAAEQQGKRDVRCKQENGTELQHAGDG